MGRHCHGPPRAGTRLEDLGFTEGAAWVSPVSKRSLRADDASMQVLGQNLRSKHLFCENTKNEPHF